jgi:hypothetical protein
MDSLPVVFRAMAGKIFSVPGTLAENWQGTGGEIDIIDGTVSF